MKYALALLAMWVPLAAQTPPSSFTISTVAGTGLLGDDGPADKAQLNVPHGLTFDAQGSLYLCDWYSERIRKIDPDGTIRRAAGGPSMAVQPYNLAEGDAERVFLNYVQFITTAPDGSIWFTNTYRIHRFDPLTNLITWVAGKNSSSTAAADGLKARDSNLVNIRAIAVNAAGEVYFTEYNKNTIRRVDSAGLLETIAGTGTASSTGDGGPARSATFDGILDLEFDAAGTLYIAQYGSIRTIDSKGIVRTYAGNSESGSSAATGDRLALRMSPKRLKFGPNGDLYVLESTRIRRIAKDTGLVSVVAGGTDYNAPYFLPDASRMLISANDIAVDAAGNVYYSVSDSGNYIARIDPKGQATIFAGTDRFRGDSSPAADALMNLPEAITPAGDGGYAFLDLGNARLRHFVPTGDIRTLVGKGLPSSINPRPTFEAKSQSAREAWLASPASLIASDRAGNFVFANQAVLFSLDSSGTMTPIAGKLGSRATPKEGETALGLPILDPLSATYDPQGRVVFSDSATIWRIESNGRLSRLAGTTVYGSSTDEGPALDLKIQNPKALVYLEDVLYFVEGNNIRRLTNEARLERVAGGGSDIKWYTAGRQVDALTANVTGTTALAFSPEKTLYGTHNNGYLYRLRDGKIEKIVGDGSRRWFGDGGPALAASLHTPFGLAADADGNFYVSDRNNSAIRKISPLQAAQLRPVSGNAQSAVAGQPFTLPLEVEVVGTLAGAVAVEGEPAPALIGMSLVPVSVRVVSGEASLNVDSGITAASGRFSAKLSALLPGPVVVEFSSEGLAPVQFELTVVPDTPILRPLADPVSPGMILTWPGSGFQIPADTPMTPGPNLGGLCISFGETQATLLAANDQAVVLQVPPSLAPGLATARATRACGSDNPVLGDPVELTVAATAPQFFFETGDARLLQAQWPAPGTVRLFLTGVGLPDPVPAAGELPTDLRPVPTDLTIWLNGAEIPRESISAFGWTPLPLPSLLTWKDLALPGLAVLEFSLPADLPAGPWPITVKVGDAFTPGEAYIAPPPPAPVTAVP